LFEGSGNQALGGFTGLDFPFSFVP
jgi:hypothetical protein